MPLTTWTSTSSLITGMFGISATAIPITIRVVSTATNTGASRGRRASPFSRPNVSAITYAAVTGRIAAASRLAPSSPTANRISANRPANGSSAFAASAALFTVCCPCTYSVAPVAMMMKPATRFAKIEPDVTSTRSAFSSSGPIPRSTTADWT